MIIREIVEANLANLLDQVLDHEGSDADFILMLQSESTRLIGTVISEIEDGFINGLNDVLPFLKANVTAFVKSACDPRQAIMATVMGVPPVMRYIEDANREFQRRKGQQEDQDMNDASKNSSEVANTLDERRKRLLKSYEKQLEKDQRLMKEV